MIISSQHHLDEEIVEAKRAAKDYAVSVSPAFTFDGVEVQVMLDGHHSFAAAKLDGVEPDITVLTATQNDNIALLNAGEIDDFLAATWMDGDYYDVETGRDVW